VSFTSPTTFVDEPLSSRSLAPKRGPDVRRCCHPAAGVAFPFIIVKHHWPSLDPVLLLSCEGSVVRFTNSSDLRPPLAFLRHAKALWAVSPTILAFACLWCFSVVQRLCRPFRRPWHSPASGVSPSCEGSIYCFADPGLCPLRPQVILPIHKSEDWLIY
jgi:hypothetical protein